MMDQFQQNMADYVQQQQRTSGVGNPPFAVAPNPVTHGSQQPHAGRKFYELNPQQREERTKWMVDEASRMIAARQTGPSKPFTPQYPTPPAADPEALHRSQVSDVASQLAARLAGRNNA